VPPLSARMRAMRLPATMLPSSPASERHTWMPLLPQSAMSLFVMSMPVASMLRMAAWMTAAMVQSAMLPAHMASEMPLAGLRLSIRWRRRRPRELRIETRPSVRSASSTW